MCTPLMLMCYLRNLPEVIINHEAVKRGQTEDFQVLVSVHIPLMVVGVPGNLVMSLACLLAMYGNEEEQGSAIRVRLIKRSSLRKAE